MCPAVPMELLQGGHQFRASVDLPPQRLLPGFGVGGERVELVGQFLFQVITVFYHTHGFDGLGSCFFILQSFGEFDATKLRV